MTVLIVKTETNSWQRLLWQNVRRHSFLNRSIKIHILKCAYTSWNHGYWESNINDSSLKFKFLCYWQNKVITAVSTFNNHMDNVTIEVLLQQTTSMWSYYRHNYNGISSAVDYNIVYTQGSLLFYSLLIQWNLDIRVHPWDSTSWLLYRSDLLMQWSCNDWDNLGFPCWPV